MRFKLGQKIIDRIRRKKIQNSANEQINDLQIRISKIQKSNFYILVDYLLSRDVNKYFDINYKEEYTVAYTDIWHNLQYVLNHKDIFRVAELGNRKDIIPDIIVAGGMCAFEENYNAAYLAQLYNLPYIIHEDGFLRSATTWVDQSVPEKYWHGISFVFDNLGAYFDATRPSLLENMLNDKNLILTDAQIKRSKKLIKKITENYLTKYNHQPIYTPNIGTHSKKVLVVDQSYGDMSIGRGLANDKTFADMLECAIKENPDADIIVKTHPDSISSGRSGYYAGMKEHDNVYKITTPINPISLINYVDKVYVCTTQLGFEALMCGKEVHVFGMPFYAGWGLAKEKQKIKRRNNKRTLEEVFYITYIMYTRYFNPYNYEQCEIEDAIDYLLHLREEYKKEMKIV